MTRNQPVDRALNCAVMHIANRLCPLGYDIAPDALSTLRQINAQLADNGRMVVYDGGSDNTIFEDNEVNYAFRAWYDWTHWRWQYNFSVQGEALTFLAQIADLKKVHGDTEQTKRWAALLYADVVGQRLYYETHKRYLTDQRAFNELYLANPVSALADATL